MQMQMLVLTLVVTQMIALLMVMLRLMNKVIPWVVLICSTLFIPTTRIHHRHQYR
jgi:hypothetical protein